MQAVWDFVVANLLLAGVVAGVALLLLLAAVVITLARRRGERSERSVRGAAAARGQAGAQGLQLVEANGTVHKFDALPVLLGRAAENRIVLKDDTVSATHAGLYYDELLRAVVIEDRDSLNGVYVDGQPTRKNVLRDQATITLGKTTLTFRDTRVQPPPAPGRPAA